MAQGDPWLIETETRTSIEMLLFVRHPHADSMIGKAVIEVHPDLLYLRSIGVVDTWRGRKIGSAILEAVMRLCDAYGRFGILKNNISRGASHANFYGRHGWVLTSQPLWLQYIPKSDRVVPLKSSFSERILELHRDQK